ncbi:hypothetical protein M0R89_14410 [Halorussus limi]|uniref:Uncharacterized protein n=1 Tax=Halorussus limi TaxID=2938695 RepID=A0A8U0HSQ9_9EURY|nr:hypothetical protein [Halorussus limi]UPV73726.1 hypothetical protein M0R89_14410 [Halorussus limi]
MSGEERRGSQKSIARFRRRLADLKRNGCNILLVGTDALDAACERLLGESSAGPRYRLFVTTDARPPTAYARLKSVQSGPYGDEAAVVNWQADVRGGSAADDASHETGTLGDESLGDGSGVRDSSDESFARVPVEGDELRDLGSTVEETIERFDADSGGLSPAELRLCFDSIVPLVADHEDRDVRRFLLGLTETVERFDGMAHYHLPAEYDSETVRSVEALFDAVVEVRYGGDGIEQRWHLSEPDMTTHWLSL